MSTTTHTPDSRPGLKRYQETEPGTLANRFMRTFWQPVALASQVVPGKAIPVHVLGESFTLYRTPDGRVALTEYRCLHRRTQLNTGWVDNDGIRCLYHGWKFAVNGQCLEIPGETNPSYAKKIQLKTYPVQEYLGLIFAYLGEDEAPEMPRYTAFEKAGHLDVSTYVRECNYFQNIENGVDEVHVNFTHSTGLFENSGLNDEVPQVQAEMTDYGLVAKGIRSGDRVREMHFLMPNMLMLKLPPDSDAERGWRDYISWRVPINDVSHHTFIVMGIDIHGEAREAFLENQQARAREVEKLEPMKDVARKILAGELSLHDLPPRPDITGIQDYVTQVGQGDIVDRNAERLGRSDLAIVMMRRLWDRELSLLESGKELTAWEVPDMLQPSKGV